MSDLMSIRTYDYVYVIAETEESTLSSIFCREESAPPLYIKLGFSEAKVRENGSVRTPKERMKELQTANPRKLKLISVRPIERVDYPVLFPFITEDGLHELFASDRVRPDSEWFKVEKYTFSKLQQYFIFDYTKDEITDDHVDSLLNLSITHYSWMLGMLQCSLGVLDASIELQKDNFSKAGISTDNIFIPFEKPSIFYDNPEKAEREITERLNAYRRYTLQEGGMRPSKGFGIAAKWAEFLAKTAPEKTVDQYVAVLQVLDGKFQESGANGVVAFIEKEIAA